MEQLKHLMYLHTFGLRFCLAGLTLSIIGLTICKIFLEEEEITIKQIILIILVVVNITAIGLILASTPYLTKVNDNVLLEYKYNNKLKSGTIVANDKKVYTQDGEAYTMYEIGYKDYPELIDGFYDSITLEQSIEIKYGLFPIRRSLDNTTKLSKTYVRRDTGTPVNLNKTEEMKNGNN